MTTIFERTAAALATLNVPYASQTYRVASGASLPDVFMTYFLVSSAPGQHADDEETLRAKYIQVSTFSRNGLASLPDVIGAMTAAGFTRAGETQLPYDQDSGHYGFAQTFMFLEE